MTGFVAVSVFAMSSCSKDSESNNSYTSTTPISAYNLYVASDGSGSSSTGLALYDFTMTFPAYTIQVSADNMAVPGGVSSSFATVPMNLKSSMVTVEETGREIISFSSDNASESSTRIRNLKGSLTQAAYFPPEVTVPGYKLLLPGNTKHYVLMQYNLNDNWDVRTFWPDVTFKGSTVTTYPGMGEAFFNSGISYRVVMQLKDKAITDKADVIFYNAKFAPKAPEITVVLKNLDLEFNERGYTIKGHDVIPYMLEAGELQETPRFKFNSFDLRVAGDLTSAVIDYRVADIYSGSFTGISVVKTSNLN